MTRLVFLLGLMLALTIGAAARAQDQVWVQIEAQPTLREAAEAEKNAARAAMMNLPLVQATLAAFPDAVQVQDTAEDRDARGGGNKWRNRA